ncbi:hypothetical protein SS05631_c16780 [Sinorhizobium sp. CCBAU 05631]|nr:hypothetical protein SS05631_c16780 [Sinorhizobium sp. CCBAU 05631]
MWPEPHRNHYTRGVPNHEGDQAADQKRSPSDVALRKSDGCSSRVAAHEGHKISEGHESYRIGHTRKERYSGDKRQTNRTPLTPNDAPPPLYRHL